MYERNFGTNIRIFGKKSKRKYDDAQDMGNKEGKAFTDKVYVLLRDLAKRPVGRNLLEEIERTNKQVIIFCDDNSGLGSAALPYPGTASNEVKRFIKIRQIPDNALRQLQAENDQFVTPAMKNYAALIHRTLESAKANRKVAAVIMGISRSDLNDIERGRKALPKEAYHRFAMFFYDHLVAGEGCSVALRFAPDQASQNDPELIILGHELIHVWRMVTGMRIFEGGWEEEAMTTGIAPFGNLKYTENKLRVEFGHPLRSSYTARCTTAHYQTVSGFEEGKGIWPEYVKAWSDWRDQNPDEARKGLKITKKSQFSKPIRHIFNR